MKRRDFLKILGIAPVSPSLLNILKVPETDNLALSPMPDKPLIEFNKNPAIGQLYWQYFADEPGKMWVYTGHPQGWMEVHNYET